MEAAIIYRWLDKLRTLVHDHTLPDGTIPVDGKKVEIALELCERVLWERLEEQH